MNVHPVHKQLQCLRIVSAAQLAIEDFLATGNHLGLRAQPATLIILPECVLDAGTRRQKRCHSKPLQKQDCAWPRCKSIASKPIPLQQTPPGKSEPC
jgi:hypothetical protein